MAQEKEVKEKPKRTRKTQKSAKEKPYVEQINELLFVHNKEDPKAGVQAVSEIDGEGKVRTVPAEEKNENSFLKFEKNSSILENFIRNFWSQLKEPTHFRLIRMTIHDYKQNRQAIKDLSQGKETDAVKEFLKRYEIRPRENKEQSKNEKETETMAKKQKSNPQEQVPQPTVSTGQPQEQQAPRYRYDENMVNWDALEKMGVSKTSLEQQGLLDSMLKGYKTNKLVPLTLTLTGARVKLDARLSFITMPDGQIGLGIHGIRKEPELERPYFGHIFTEEDKKNLRETGNMGRVAELNLNGGAYTPCLISIDKNTNELVAVRQENVYIPSEVKGIKLTADEINALKEGKPEYEVCGVVKDFHCGDALDEFRLGNHNAIRVPSNHDVLWTILVKTCGDHAQALSAIQSACKQVAKEQLGVPTDMDTEYLDDTLADALKEKHNMMVLIITFMGISILISALDLLASSSFARTGRENCIWRSASDATTLSTLSIGNCTIAKSSR
jgi:hypothetical protein